MTEQEIIREFQYNGCDITAYQGSIEIVNTNESKFIDNNKRSIATSRTFSCTNLLVFCKEFAYLVHMFPSEMVGMNNDFDNRLIEIKNLINHYNPSRLNVLVALGESVPHIDKQNFHNLTYLEEKLSILNNHCNKLNIEINFLPIMKSKYLLFDLESFLLYIDNKNKEVINVDNLINNISSKKR